MSNTKKEGNYMSKKNKIIIGVSAVVFIEVIVLVVILVMKKGIEIL